LTAAWRRPVAGVKPPFSGWWADRNRVALPQQFRASKAPAVAQGIQVVGMAVLVYGLVELDLLAVVTGTVLTQAAKAWYLAAAAAR
jgi:hypothetical protein